MKIKTPYIIVKSLYYHHTLMASSLTHCGCVRRPNKENCVTFPILLDGAVYQCYETFLLPDFDSSSTQIRPSSCCSYIIGLTGKLYSCNKSKSMALIDDMVYYNPLIHRHTLRWDVHDTTIVYI